MIVNFYEGPKKHLTNLAKCDKNLTSTIPENNVFVKVSAVPGRKSSALFFSLRKGWLKLGMSILIFLDIYYILLYNNKSEEPYF